MFHPRHLKTRSGVSVGTLLFILALLTCAPAPPPIVKAADDVLDPRGPAATPYGEASPVPTLVSDAQAATSLIRFASDSLTIDEGSGHIDITVTRAGDASGTAAVDYHTTDESGAGRASQKSDYEIALGTLTFAPGETSKTFRLLLVDDGFVEGAETVGLTLSNARGVDVGLGSPASAEVTVNDNDSTPSAANPIDDPQFFVRQHYLDFLNREPDPSGFQFWVNQLVSCGADAACREVKRVNVSAAFFLSIEFQQTSLSVYLPHKLAFGGSPSYVQFMRDLQALQRNFVFGQAGADAQFEANKRAYFDEFVTRPEFVAKFGGMSNGEFVRTLLPVDSFLSRASLFFGRLDGSQAVPPRDTPATGFLLLELEPEVHVPLTKLTSISLSLSNLTSPETAAHIHGPADPGSDSPILISLPLGDFKGFQTLMTVEQQSLLRGGRAYVDVHTEDNPGGEIRAPLVGGLMESALTGALNDGVLTRAQVLRVIVESETFRRLERNAQPDFNHRFVQLQYYGYLRRDPDQEGFGFWLNKLRNTFGGNFTRAEMVKAFINSDEYRRRFGP